MNDSIDTVKAAPAVPAGKWLLLIHQIPPKPDYFRVKVRRRLQRIGAIALKNSVYVLPSRPEAIEDFRWLLREIVAEGGDATLCQGAFVEGITQAELVGAFGADRDEDYAELLLAAHRATPEREVLSEDASSSRSAIDAELGRLRRRLEEITAIDYFGAPGRRAAERAITTLETRLRSSAARSAGPKSDLEEMKGRVWVTRKDVYVDRIASAWLVRRFIDPNARFKFTGSKTYQPKNNEVRFDMFDAEFTHEGDRCTFEIILERASIRDRRLRAIAEIVHDIDCKDSKFNRPETPGIAALLRGLVRSQPEDRIRLERGASILDDLYASLS